MTCRAPGEGCGAYDVEAAGGQFLPEYIFASTNTKPGREAFLDAIMEVSMFNEGPPDVFSEEVLGFITELMSKEEEQENEIKSQKALRLEIVAVMFIRTEEWDDHTPLPGLAQSINAWCQENDYGPITGDDREWAGAMREVFDLETQAHEEQAGQE